MEDKDLKKTFDSHYLNLPRFTEDILEYIFSFIKKQDAMSTAQVCIKFSKIFTRPKLRAVILNNHTIDYHGMDNDQLKNILLERPDMGMFILAILQMRFNRGTLGQHTLRIVISKCPLPILLQFGKFIGFIDESSESQDRLIYGLLEKIVCSAEYYSGQPEYSNSLFMSLVDNLGRLDVENLEKYPMLKQNIITIFQYTYLSLLDDSKEKSNLSDVFNQFFAFETDSTRCLMML